MLKFENNPDAVLTEEHSAMEKRNYTGSFCGFILLDKPEYNLTALAERMKQRWGIAPETSPEEQVYVEGGEDGDWLDQLLAEESVDVLTAPEIHDGNLVFDMPGAMVAIGYMPEPVPEGEAERFAKNSYFWPGAAQAAAGHAAHLMIAVLPRDMAPVEAGKTYVRIMSSCLEDKNAIAAYTSGTVLEPAFYQKVTDEMQQGKLPVYNWIYFGTYQNENGNNAYTIGMDAFGKDELEILASKRSDEEMRSFLYDVAYYVLEGDITLKSGETIGFTDDQKFLMKRGDAVAVEGHSVQIAF